MIDRADNISSITGDYYARRTLSYVLGANDPLLGAHRKRKWSRGTDSAEHEDINEGKNHGGTSVTNTWNVAG